MRRFTKLWATLLLLCIAGVANAAKEYEVDQRFNSLADLLTSGELFSIVNETDGKMFCFGVGSEQDMNYETYSDAYAKSKSYTFKLEAAQGDDVAGYYYLRPYKPDGTLNNVWGWGGYFNSQPATGTVCFCLGLNNQNGQDIKNGAVWVLEESDGKFALKNVGTGLYLKEAAPAKYEEVTYFTFCTLKEIASSDPLAEQKEALESAIAKGKMFNAVAYTEASFTALGTAITAGEAALAAADATAESLTAAQAAIETAQAALKLKDGYTELTQAQFFEWDSATEPTTSKATGCAYELFKPSNMVYGNSSVGLLTFADLSAYDKFIVTVAEGTPRILLNRDVNEGQWNANEEESHLIDNTLDGWHNKYFTSEDNIFTVDVKQLAADKGFAHLHSIKSRAMVTVTGLYLYKENAAGEATIVDWVASEQNYENSQELDGIAIAIDDKTTMTCAKGTGSTTPKYYTSGSAVRTYGGNVITFKGEGITKIVITGVNGKVAELTANTGELTTEGIVTTWKGEANEIVLTNATTNQQHIAKVHVVYGGEEPDVEPVHIANTAETAYTVAKAVELIEAGDALDEKVFVKGIVSKVEKFDETEKYITYWISSDGSTEGQQFECYKGKGIDGADFAAIEDVEVGAEIIATGTLTKYQTTYELSAGNTLVTYKAPVKPVIAEGNYYLYNVAAEGFIIGANNWGTRASISKIGGIEVEAVMTPDGKYELKTASLYAGKHLGFNGYVDNGDESNWTIAPVEGQEGVYTLTTNDGKVLFWDGGEATSTSVAAMPETAENAYWKFISVADRLATLANATAENPVEATFLINNPDFGRNTSKAAWQGDDFGIGGGNDVNNNAEKWGGNSQTFDIRQTIELPNGLYKLTWNGFYRYNNTLDNTNDVAAAAHADGSEVIYSYIHINNDSIALTSIADEAAVEAFGKMPFSQGEAAAAFGMGLYEQTAELTIEDGQLIIGIKKFEHPGCDWTVWDNFRLSYLGLPVSEDEAEKEVPEGWENLIANGNMAGDDVSNFFSKEAPAPDPYASTITPGAGKDNSRGIIIKSINSGGQDWDSQFFIRANKQIPAGTKLHMEFDYKATAAANVSTQGHGEPGGYVNNDGVGTVKFTTEWQHLSQDFTTSGDIQTIAFNMNVLRDEASYYIDNIVFWAEKPAEIEWADIIVNGTMEENDAFNFKSKIHPAENASDAAFTAGAGKDGSQGIVIESPAKASNPWDTQFWITLPIALEQGTMFKVEFDYKADAAVNADTQYHAAPGDYIGNWSSIGFTTEWQHYEKQGIAPGANNNGNKFQSIAFNLSFDNATNLYFDNVKLFLDKETAATGIKSVNTETPFIEGAVYDLQGRRVAKPARGLYIINGKKVMVK